MTRETVENEVLRDSLIHCSHWDYGGSCNCFEAH